MSLGHQEMIESKLPRQSASVEKGQSVRGTECPTFSAGRLAADEDAAAGAERIAEAAKTEAATRAAHIGVRHRDTAVRAHPARVLTKRDNPVILLHLLGVVVKKACQVASVGQDAAGNSQTLRYILASLVGNEPLNPQVHRPDTGAREREPLLCEGGIDVAEIGRPDRALDEWHQADRLVVGGGEADWLGGGSPWHTRNSHGPHELNDQLFFRFGLGDERVNPLGSPALTTHFFVHQVPETANPACAAHDCRNILLAHCPCPLYSWLAPHLAPLRGFRLADQLDFPAFFQCVIARSPPSANWRNGRRSILVIYGIATPSLCSGSQ